VIRDIVADVRGMEDDLNALLGTSSSRRPRARR
jgi:hypothetical protein